MGFHWRADDDPLIVVFGSSHQQKNLQNFLDPRTDKKVVLLVTKASLSHWKVSEYDKEMPQPHSVDQPLVL